MAAAAHLLNIFANMLMHSTHNKSTVLSAPFNTFLPGLHSTDFPPNSTQKKAIYLAITAASLVEVIGFHVSSVREREVTCTLELIDHLHGQSL